MTVSTVPAKSAIDSWCKYSNTRSLHLKCVHCQVQTAGHFPDVPALPASTVGANMMHLMSLGLQDELSGSVTPSNIATLPLSTVLLISHYAPHLMNLLCPCPCLADATTTAVLLWTLEEATRHASALYVIVCELQRMLDPDNMALCRPVPVRVVQHVMKYRSLPVLGETLSFTVTRVACKNGVTHFKGHVVVEGSQRDIMLVDLHLVPEGDHDQA